MVERNNLIQIEQPASRIHISSRRHAERAGATDTRKTEEKLG